MESNDQEEVDKTEDTGADSGEDATQETGEATSTQKEKTSETPEDKHARLLRQTNRQRKAMGLPPLVEALVEKQVTPKANQNKGFDYAEKAYLKSSGIDAEDFALVKEVMDSTGKDIDGVLASKHFQAELKERKDVRMTEAAIPSGTKRAGNATRDTVDYWQAKIAAGTAKLSDIPDRKLRQDVVNARYKSEKAKKQFYNS